MPSLYSRSSGSIIKLRFRIRSITASLTTVFVFPFSLSSADRADLCINLTEAPWLVVKRRMGVKVLMYLKFRNREDLWISS